MLLFATVKRGECQNDEECPDNRACIENQCLDPCNSDPCGRNAICETKAHIPICKCPPNTAGNPHEECYSCKFNRAKLCLLSFL